MNHNSELDPELESLIQTLRRTEPRDPQQASHAREIFLAEAAQSAPAVSTSHRNRLEGWKETFTTFWHVNRKEKSPMFNFVMTVVLVLGAVLGGGVTTVAAAQAAKPDETLYPVKTWSEEIRLGWETDPQAKFDLALQFTARRAEEIETMLIVGSVVPEPVITRLESQQQMALQFAANLPDELALPALERVRDQARQQEQAMQQLQLTDPVCEQIRERVQTMLQTQAQSAQSGLDDPEQLRDQLRLRNRLHLDTPIVAPSETSEGTTKGSNPWTTGTPTPGSSYGPGESQNPWTDETPTPGSGYGPGESQNPWTDGTPTPGSGYGPGSGTGDCSNCTPQSNQGSPTDQPAPQPENGNGSSNPESTQSPGGGGNGNGKP